MSKLLTALTDHPTAPARRKAVAAKLVEVNAAWAAVEKDDITEEEVRAFALGIKAIYSGLDLDSFGGHVTLAI